MSTAALIVAAGAGTRTGGDLPKQYRMLGGKAVLAHAYDSFAAHEAVSQIVIVIGAGQEELAAEALKGRPVAALIFGGAERQHSVRAGLDVMMALGGIQNVLIHDAARPFVPHRVIESLMEALVQSKGAVPSLPVVDSLARGESALGEAVDRNALVRVQTPQAFHLDAIYDAHDRWNGLPATDDAQIARAAGLEVTMVEGDSMMEKITHPADFAVAEARLARGLVSRSGIGFDVHRLEAGRPLWLGGVEIPHEKGLAGHSDADVALHAVVDALLGAISAGDIGQHFPPSDPRWKNADSARFAEHARDLVGAAGGIIDHVDLTIICEAPKIGPYRDAIRARLAQLLSVETRAISVKATTTEALGFTGRREGIAAQAIATVRSPA